MVAGYPTVGTDTTQPPVVVVVTTRPYDVVTGRERVHQPFYSTARARERWERITPPARPIGPGAPLAVTWSRRQIGAFRKRAVVYD